MKLLKLEYGLLTYMTQNTKVFPYKDLVSTHNAINEYKLKIKSQILNNFV